MAYEFKLPDLGEGLTEGEIARWLVAEGQEIAEDDPLVEVQTDKTTVEIPSPAAGKVARILVEEGAVVPVGTVLVVIGEDGAAPAAEQPAAEPAASVRATTQGQSPGPGQPGRVRATPLVRRMAEELGVDVASVEATGPQGRVTEEDVRRAAASLGLSPGQGQEGRREPLRGVRRLVAEHMTRGAGAKLVNGIVRRIEANAAYKKQGVKRLKPPASIELPHQGAAAGLPSRAPASNSTFGQASHGTI